MAVDSIERPAAVGAETAFLPGEDPEQLRPLSAALERAHSWFNSRPDHIGKLETAIYITGIASFALLRGLNLI